MGCNSGFTGTGQSCQDVNECSAGTANCDANALCSNTDGGYSCTCNSGFTGTGQSCQDVNECSAGTANCDANALCSNTDGGYSCTCNTGYDGDGFTCSSVGCTLNCDYRASCRSLEGSGYECVCQTGYTGDGTSCTNVNECINGLDNRNPYASCSNTDGGYSCTCNSGW